MSSIWCENDKHSFKSSTIGQINERTVGGRVIADILQTDKTIKNVLEIGTWNGLGSTACFLKALEKNENVKLFQSLECNHDKNQQAIQNLKPFMTDSKKIELIWGSVLKHDQINNEHLFEIFPELIGNAEFQKWHNIDLENMKLCPFVLHQIPDQVDLVLFDGGEFTTYFEFLVLYKKCSKYILLDDCNVSKCKQIRQILKNSNKWLEISYSNERNGFSAFQKL